MPHAETLITAPRCYKGVLATVADGGLPVPSHDQLGLGHGATTGPAYPKAWSFGVPSLKTRPPATLPTTTCTHARQTTTPTRPAVTPTRAPLPLAQRNLNSLNARSARSSNDDINCVKKGLVAENDPDTPSAKPFALIDSAVDEAPVTPIEAPHRGCCHKLQQQQQPRTHLQRPLREVDKEIDWRHRELERAAFRNVELAHLKAETNRILARQHKRDMGRRQRLELQLSDGRHLPPLPASDEPSPLPSPKTRSPVLEKISLLARGRRLRGTGLSPTSTSSLRSAAASSISPTSSTSAALDTTPPSNPQPMANPPNFIEAGGRGQTDAPRGAINGGERRVAVRCRGIVLDLVVSVETTAVDILVASSDQSGQPFNVKTSTLTESYAQLGLERRIRRYERIRDILNSWNQDTQNTLVVTPDLLLPNNDLELAAVPRTDKPPSGFILPLYYLAKPGKWSKRYITLLEGGQLVLSKKLEPGPSDKDSFNLCHLSDFDIYVPTEAQKRKQPKPPKKYCFAVKSQQKAAVFLNTDNYVHHFCTDDSDVGQEFHDGVHAWRSWYIANRALQLYTKKVAPEEPPQILPVEPSPPKKSVGHVKVNGHKVKVSVDESPYSIGAFEPLMNLRRFDKPLEEFGNDWEPDSRQSIAPRAAAPPGSSESGSDGKRKPLMNMSERGQGAFAEGGLLGTAYEMRKQAQREGNRRSQISDQASLAPFAQGLSLLNGRKSSNATASTGSNVRQPGSPASPASTEKSASSRRSADGVEPPGWFPSAIEHSAKTRPFYGPSVSSVSASRSERDQYNRYCHDQQPHSSRRPTQPLVDLTPTFMEPPQWSRHNSGRGYRVPQGKPLVDFATGPPISSSRTYEQPPRALVRRGDTSSVHSTSSASTAGQQRQGSSVGVGRRPTVRSDRPPTSSTGRSMGSYNRAPLISFATSGENRGRSYTSSSGHPSEMGSIPMRPSPASSVVASERGARGTGRERSGTLA
ncbi:hypothetical protein QBC34DRAFT_221045 [Podospora aff. communis PSN243]|uniref:PH domain-containing protein n=1 Tax=Podospora aff. communis PSN243 TaxID=3040156 RepID=A0AAV9GZZ8_9PEZI|nr:hypothetical protein QBC34DRAFT_221045 [Podospora aff. communis PSN243]